MSFRIYRAKDTEWIEGCRRRDAQAQRQVFDHYSSRMYGVCCRYVRDKMEAEDVMITSFTKVFERIGQFKGDGSFEGWIRRIVVNEALTHLRRSKALAVATDIEEADREPDYQQLDNALEAADLLAMVQALPAGYRMVFNLYAIDGYSHQEIAEQLGISENTSKSQLSRARALLQRQLEELENEWKIKSTSHEQQAG
ncbi:MAG: sigma-70 family RNA polymerase sigma factor [Cyclobacteriaceae bacterium]|nr:sigma-70 family RNA polymerase sigma factor [Cyclobacteriaceae bacterium]